MPSTITSAGTLAESCIESNDPSETTARANSVNGDRDNESAARSMVPAVIHVADPNGTLLLAWPATVTGPVRLDASPTAGEAATLVAPVVDAGVDDVVGSPTTDDDLARETNGCDNGDETELAGKDTGWWIVIPMAAPTRGSRCNNELVGAECWIQVVGAVGDDASIAGGGPSAGAIGVADAEAETEAAL